MTSLKNCEELIRISHLISSVPSILGGTFVVLSFQRIPKIRNASFYLILATSISDSMFSVAWLFPVPKDRSWLCRLQGWWMQFFPLFSVYLALLTAVHIYLLIKGGKSKKLRNETLLKFGILAMIVALIGSIIPLFTDRYGLIGKHCWIALDEDGRDKKAGMAHRLGLQYVQVWTVCVVNSVLYYEIFRYSKSLFKNLSRSTVVSTVSVDRERWTGSSRSSSGSRINSNKATGSSRKKEDKVMQLVLRLRWYPVIMFLSWSGLIMLRLYQFYSQSIPCWLVMAALSLLNLQGFWNSIIFSLNDTVRASWYKSLGWELTSPQHQERPTSSKMVGRRNSSNHSSNLLPFKEMSEAECEKSDSMEMRESSTLS